MFTHNCYIRKNTPQLRQRLEDIGHKLAQDDWGEKSINKCRTIFIGPPFRDDLFYIGYMESKSPKYLNEHNFIDCGENEDLFIAIASIQDNTDKNQWFVSDEGNFRYSTDNIFNVSMANYINYYHTHWHKATVEEIINKFK